MKKIAYYIALLTLLTASKCKDDPQPTASGSLDMTVKINMNGSPFVINKVYDISGVKVRFTRFSYFITNTATTNASGDFVAKLDFSDLDTEAKAAAGLKVTIPNLEPCSGCTFNYGIGIKPDLNKKKPKDFPSTNPLSDGGDYWDSWSSYIFTKLEGMMDRDGDGRFETGITLHSGGNECYRTATPLSNLGFSNNKATANLTLNMNTVLKNIDLTKTTSSHQVRDLPIMMLFCDNLKSALKSE